MMLINYAEFPACLCIHIPHASESGADSDDSQGCSLGAPQLSNNWLIGGTPPNHDPINWVMIGGFACGDYLPQSSSYRV